MNILTKSNKISKILLSSVLAGSMVLSLSPITFAKTAKKVTTKVVAPTIKTYTVKGTTQILDKSNYITKNTFDSKINMLTYNGKKYIEVNNSVFNLFNLNVVPNGNFVFIDQGFSSPIASALNEFSEFKKTQEDDIKWVKEAKEQIANLKDDNAKKADLLKKYVQKYGLLQD